MAHPLDDIDSEGPQGTLLENVEELRRQIAARAGAPAREPTPPPASSAVPYRPSHRPPMALLTVLFDGREEGDIVALRTDRTLIGRTEGEVIIPHDGMVSSRHAEITRLFDKGRWRWFLTDLGSTNGTFVRVTTVQLKHEQEFLLGARRYRFDAPSQTGPAAGKQGDHFPSVVELKTTTTGQRYFLEQEEHWIGSEPGQASIVIADDPMVSPNHARIIKDTKGRWILENAGSQNGVWIRIHRIPIEGTAQFQIGEQRFILKPL